MKKFLTVFLVIASIIIKAQESHSQQPSTVSTVDLSKAQLIHRPTLGDLPLEQSTEILRVMESLQLNVIAHEKILKQIDARDSDQSKKNLKVSCLNLEEFSIFLKMYSKYFPEKIYEVRYGEVNGKRSQFFLSLINPEIGRKIILQPLKNGLYFPAIVVQEGYGIPYPDSVVKSTNEININDLLKMYDINKRECEKLLIQETKTSINEDCSGAVNLSSNSGKTSRDQTRIIEAITGAQSE
jgi:hypothetical protein